MSKPIPLSDTAKRLTKSEAYAVIAEMHATNTLPARHLIDGLLLHFAPPRPSKPKTPFAWVAQACSPKDPRPQCHYVLASGGWMCATDGHRMHRAPTDLEDGVYHPRTGVPVDMSAADFTHYTGVVKRTYDMFYRAVGDVLDSPTLERGTLPLPVRTLETVKFIDPATGADIYIDAAYFDAAAAGRDGCRFRISQASEKALVLEHDWGTAIVMRVRA